MNRMEDARSLLEKLLRVNPASVKGHVDLGIAYAATDRSQDALAEFKRAIALKPDDVNAHWRLGRLYRSMGKASEATAEFEKAKSLNKSADEGLVKMMSTAPHPASSSKASPAIPTEK